MDSRERPSTLVLRDLLREAAAATASQLVEELVAQVGGATVTTLQTRFDLWPGAEATKSESIARVEAAPELERAAIDSLLTIACQNRSLVSRGSYRRSCGRSSRPEKAAPYLPASPCLADLITQAYS
jgi:hypothetical protein